MASHACLQANWQEFLLFLPFLAKVHGREGERGRNHCVYQITVTPAHKTNMVIYLIGGVTFEWVWFSLFSALRTRSWQLCQCDVFGYAEANYPRYGPSRIYFHIPSSITKITQQPPANQASLVSGTSSEVSHTSITKDNGEGPTLGCTSCPCCDIVYLK